MLRSTQCRKCECNLSCSGNSESISMCSACNELVLSNFFKNHFPKQIILLESSGRRLRKKIENRKEKLKQNLTVDEKSIFGYDIKGFEQDLAKTSSKIIFIKNARANATVFILGSNYSRKSFYDNVKILIKHYLADYCEYLDKTYGEVVIR